MRFFLLVLAIGCILNTSAQRLIFPGSYPDPSVTKIGDTYWASATSSNWFPIFPLFHSKNLMYWKQSGYIFYKKPDWADYYFWAPELSYDSGKVYVYYTAHKKDGNLCVGVASADRPEGPYTDHGPLVCQEFGSIDAFPMRDTTGKLYLVWKEDANSVSKPTPIWAQEMNKERTALIGERRELFRNDAPWEHELVEGVSMIKRNEYFYAFYAAAGCCGSRCTYVTGVARAKSVLGPWEKYSKNPILPDDSSWICKGHGTAVERNGRYFFIYHAYDRQSNAFTGREGLLQEFKFTPDNWVEFITAKSDTASRKEILRDEFSETVLPQIWQWDVFNDVKYELKDGKLHLLARPENNGSYIAQKIPSASYSANTTVFASQSTSFAGIAAIGDENNMVALLIKDFQLQVVKVKDGKDSVITFFRIPVKEKVYLQMSVERRYRIYFLYSLDGKKFIRINADPIRGAFLPPWDSPPRAALISRGEPGEVAVFDRFEVRTGSLKSSKITEEVRGVKPWQVVIYILTGIAILAIAFRIYRRYKLKKRSEKREQVLVDSEEVNS